MKKLILLTVALCLVASSAFAWPILRVNDNGLTRHVQSYNSSFMQSIRVTPVGYRVTYSYSACGALVVTVQDTFLGVPVGEPRVTEFACP